MAKVSFLLYAPGADKPTPIFATTSFDGQRHRLYTGLSIHPSKWLKADQRAQVRGRGNELNGALNDALEVAETALLTCYSTHRAAGTLPTAAQLKEAIAPAAPEPETLPSPTKLDFLATFTDWTAGRTLTHTPNTLRTYRTILRHLQDFKTKMKQPVDFAVVGNRFAQKLAEYLLTHRQLRDTAVRKNLVILKCFLA